MKLLGIEMPLEEFDTLIVAQSEGKELKVVNDKVVAVEHVPTIEEVSLKKIQELKSLLLNTDYKAIKYAEGLITEEEYEPIKQQRQSWRDEINRLEKEI